MALACFEDVELEIYLKVVDLEVDQKSLRLLIKQKFGLKTHKLSRFGMMKVVSA